jgi:hypothetical protein
MKRFKILVAVAMSALMIASCNKEEVTAGETVNNNPQTRHALDHKDLGAYLDMTKDQKDPKVADYYAEIMATYVQDFRVAAERELLIVTKSGTTLTMPANNLVDARGRIVRGIVDVEFIEVFERGDMVVLDKGTSGFNSATGAVDALTSGGEFYVSISQGGVELTLIAPLVVTVPSTVLDDDMGKFVEMDGTGDDLLWEERLDEDVEVKREGEGGGSYSFNILPGEWGWTNIDKFYNDPCPKTPIYVEVPAGHDNTNTEVYLSYDGDPGRLANFDMWDGTRFTEHYGQICIGIPVHFIAVTNVGGGLEYDIHPATITSGHVEVFTSFTPISETALVALINGLP